MLKLASLRVMCLEHKFQIKGFKITAVTTIVRGKREREREREREARRLESET